MPMDSWVKEFLCEISKWLFCVYKQQLKKRVFSEW
jgi:hypothetical protein